MAASAATIEVVADSRRSFIAPLPIDPEAIVRPLCSIGLIHRMGEDFIFATAAAFRMVQTVGHVV